MHPHKIEFTLKQHTPIIHFQSDQAGATIRATELKPKFDRFLIKHIFKRDKARYEQYLIDKNKSALNYKVRILNRSNKSQKLRYKTYLNPNKAKPHERVGAYFGNNDALMFGGDIVVSFIVQEGRLLEIIREHFEAFMLITNFGTRQNKGFGSFSVTKIEDKEVRYNKMDAVLLMRRYYPKVYTASSKEPLRKIHEEYQLLKSGRNRPYVKSYLFEYMCTKKRGWEKRMIKQQLEKRYAHLYRELKYEKPPAQCRNEIEDFFYIRALLGTCDNIEFLKRNSRNFKDKIKVRLKCQNNDIERYKSPLTYKVIEKDIFVLADDRENVRGEIFDFGMQGGGRLGSLQVPEDFDLFAFLDFALIEKMHYQSYGEVS
jgi:hypothetical protein